MIARAKTLSSFLGDVRIFHEFDCLPALWKSRENVGDCASDRPTPIDRNIEDDVGALAPLRNRAPHSPPRNRAPHWGPVLVW